MITHENASRIATGGGPPVIKNVRPEEKPLFDKVRALILPVAVGYSNPYDTDKAVSSAVYMDNNGASSGDDEVNQQNDESINGDWSACSPANLRSPRTVILREFPATSHQIELGHNEDVTIIAETYLLENPEPLTSASVAPKKNPGSSAKNGGSRRRATSRRRPVISNNLNDELATEKIKGLKTASKYAAEEHELTMKINTEKLKQEKIRTKILEEKLKKINRGESPSSESDSIP